VSVRTTIALALLVALAGCSGADEPRDAPTADIDAGLDDGPVVVEPTTALLDWQDTGVEVGTRFVQGPEWEAIGSDDDSSVELVRGGDTIEIDAGPGRTISEVLMSEDWAVVVRQDTTETAPSEVVAVDLATGEQRDVVSPPAASGGSWALTGGDLYYPTYGDAGAYCLATSALADGNGEDGWCAPGKNGFSGLTASDHGVGMMTFDDARPIACRTVNLLEAGVPKPLDHADDCRAWDVAATAGGVVWSEVPRPRRQEEARFSAVDAGASFDLGPGTTGSLVPCGDSVFFARDPQGPDEPARLMRWTPERTLEIAYESASVGNAFLGEPVCGGGALTLTSFGESGDEHVSARVE